jgi:carboxyl-terminal processing protease
MSYYLKHRKQLEATTLNDYINNFVISENMLAEVKELGNNLDLEFNEEDYQASKNHLKAYVKAEIARSVWDDAGFYPIYNNVSNESFTKALTLFDQAQALVSNQ